MSNLFTVASFWSHKGFLSPLDDAAEPIVTNPDKYAARDMHSWREPRLLDMAVWPWLYCLCASHARRQVQGSVSQGVGPRGGREDACDDHQARQATGHARAIFSDAQERGKLGWKRPAGARQSVWHGRSLG